jgi:hypothetical protein
MIPFAVEQGNFKLFCYLCSLTDKNQKVTINYEATDYRWVTKSEIQNADKETLFGDTLSILNTI